MIKETLKKYLPLQMQRAKELGMNWVADIQLSPLSKKKYRVILSDGSHVDYGNINYEDFLIHGDPERRRRFLARWSHHPNFNNIHSPVYYIVRLNW